MTPQTISLEEAKGIIAQFTDQCHCYDYCPPAYKHSILIGDVLDKLSKHKDGYVLNGEKTMQIVDLWWNCGDEYYEEGEKCLKNGFTKSLNQILEEAERQHLITRSRKVRNTEQVQVWEEWCLKPLTPQSNLFLFLNQLFN